MYAATAVIAAALWGVIHGGPAAAEDLFPLAEDPFLSSLVAEALEKNPELRWAEESASAAKARIPQASALPDPTVAIGYQNGGRGLGSDDDTFVGLSVSQAFPFPGKRRLAERLESKEAERAAQPVARTRRALVARIRRAFTDLLLARENMALIEDQRQAGQDIEALTRSRYAVGLAEQPDVLRAQAELARLDQMNAHEEGNETAAIAELNRILARPSGTPLPTTRRLASIAEVPIQAPAIEPILARGEQASADLAEARLSVARSRAAVDLARRNLKPDFVGTAAYMNRGSMPDMWSVELGVVLPLRAGHKQRQAIVEAEARLRADEAAVESVWLNVRARAERNVAELRAAIREADTYSRGVLVVDRLAAESALANYQAGKVPFVAVLEAQNTLYRDRWLFVELLAHVLWHSAALEEFAAND